MKEFDPVLTLKYNKFYIGLSRGDGQPFNFAQFRPKKNHVIFEPKLPQIDDIHEHHREGGFGYPRVQQALGLLPPAPYKGWREEQGRRATRADPTVLWAPHIMTPVLALRRGARETFQRARFCVALSG
jgi:hypothetical protein